MPIRSPSAFTLAVSLAATSCAVVSVPSRLDAQALSDAQPWHFSGGRDEARFYHGDSSISIRPRVFPSPPPQPPLVAEVCLYLAQGSPDAGATFKPGAITGTTDLKKVVFGRVVANKGNCWDIAFDMALATPHTPFVIHLVRIEGPLGSSAPLPPVKFALSAPGHRVCVMLECLVSH